MVAPAINPDASIIPDDAEVWIQSKASVDQAGGIGNCLPASIADDADALELLGWNYVGLIDAGNGIPFETDGEVNEFDGFGHPAYRKKFTKGKVNTGFTCLEDNAVTAGIVLPGSDPSKLGAPRDLQFYVLYRVVDEGYSERILVSTRNALLELTSHSGYVEGEQTSYEFTVHHSGDGNKDVFHKIGGSQSLNWELSVTATGGSYTLTFGGETTSAIAYDANAAAIKAALVALDDGYKAGQWTVTGSAPVAITLPAAGVLAVDVSSLTGGSATVSQAA